MIHQAWAIVTMKWGVFLHETGFRANKPATCPFRCILNLGLKHKRDSKRNKERRKQISRRECPFWDEKDLSEEDNAGFKWHDMLFGLDVWTSMNLRFPEPERIYDSKPVELCRDLLGVESFFFGQQRPLRVFAGWSLSFLFLSSLDSTLCEFLLNNLSHFGFSTPVASWCPKVFTVETLSFYFSQLRVCRFPFVMLIGFPLSLVIDLKACTW